MQRNRNHVVEAELARLEAEPKCRLCGRALNFAAASYRSIFGPRFIVCYACLARHRAPIAVEHYERRPQGGWQVAEASE